MDSWKLWLARDSAVWTVLFYLGFIVTVGTAFIDAPADYGIGPVLFRWMQLVSAVITALAGKLGLSPLAKKIDVETQGRLL